MMTSACPTFPSRDLAATQAFFATLGFTLGSLYPEEGYLILYRDQVELHFWRHLDHVPETSDHVAFIRVKDANAMSSELTQAGHPTEGIPRVTVAEDKPWGGCEFAIVDPDGTLLRVGHVTG